MKKTDIALEAIKTLKKQYPDAICSLSYESPFQLLAATRLSAQCTDARVNLVTPLLFKKFGTPKKMAGADLLEIEEIIKPCGLYKTKAKSLIEMANQLLSNFDGEVPDSIEKLTSLSGIGRKTANLIMGDVFKQPAIVTDTHLIRITNRLGLVDTDNPLKVEMALKKIIPLNESSDFCHRVVLFGRDICKAISPKCTICPMSHFCKKINIKKVRRKNDE